MDERDDNKRDWAQNTPPNSDANQPNLEIGSEIEQEIRQELRPTTSPLESLEPLDPLLANEAPQQPIVVPPAVEVTAPVVHKKSHGLIIVIVALVLLLLAAASVIAYLLFFQPKPAGTSTNATADTPAQTETTASVSAKDLIEKARSAVTTNLTAAYPSLTIEDGTTAPFYKASTADYAVYDSEHGYSLKVAPIPGRFVGPNPDLTKALASVRQTVEDLFVSETSFTRSTSDLRDTFQNDDIICTVNNDNPVEVSCAGVDIYDDEIAEAAPFAKAYLASEVGKQHGDGVFMGLIKINDKGNGYRNAVVSVGNINSQVGGFAGLFYEVDGTWAYWTGTQSELPCADYNTHNLQKAFESDSCYDDSAVGQTSTVKVTL